MRVATKIELSAQECAMLERVARSEKTSARLARRAKIVLLAAQGKENIEIASALGWGACMSAVVGSAMRSKDLQASNAICRVADASA